MSTKPGKRSVRALTAHEKLDAIRRVHDGESKASVARDIGVPESTLRGWCKNEDKISYLSRQSSPEGDDSSLHHEPKEKKAKVEDLPYNLSLKGRVSHSPPAPTDKVPALPPPAAIGEGDRLFANVAVQETPKSTQGEREPKNKAELARMKFHLGLNQPENTNGSSIMDLTALRMLAQLQAEQQQKNNNIPHPIDAIAAFAMARPSLLGYASPKIPDQKAKLPKAEPQKHNDDSVLAWINQSAQHAALALSLSQSSNLGVATSSDRQSNGASPAFPLSMGSLVSHYYNQYEQQTSAKSCNKEPPLLYQQLTKDKCVNNAENIQRGEKPKSSPKSRGVLDALLEHNNNNNKRDYNEEELTYAEGIQHGEKFLRWLESCGDPTVTAVQIMQLKGVLNNIKSGLERKNGEHAKTKVRRK